MEESIKYRFTRKRALTTHTHCCWYFCTIARHQRHPVNTATPYWSEKWSMGRTKPPKRTKRNPRTLSRAVCKCEAVVGHHHLRVCADSCVDGVSITRMNESSLRTVDLECSVKQNSFLIDFRCCMSRFWRRSSSLCKRWRRMQSRIEKEPQRRNWRKKSIACCETKTLKFNFWPRKVETQERSVSCLAALDGVVDGIFCGFLNLSHILCFQLLPSVCSVSCNQVEWVLSSIHLNARCSGSQRDFSMCFNCLDDVLEKLLDHHQAGNLWIYSFLCWCRVGYESSICRHCHRLKDAPPLSARFHLDDNSVCQKLLHVRCR